MCVCCATRRNVAVSIPYEVIRVSHSRNHSYRTMTLGSTQLERDMSTLGFSGGKSGQCVGLTTLPPSCTGSLVIPGASKLLEYYGPVHASVGIILICVHVYIGLFND